MKTGGTFSEKPKATEQYDTRDGIVRLAETGARHVMVDETLGQEPGEQALGNAVAKVKLDAGIVDGVRWRKAHGADRGLHSPAMVAFPIRGRLAKAIESWSPGGIETLADFEVRELVKGAGLGIVGTDGGKRGVVGDFQRAGERLLEGSVGVVDPALRLGDAVFQKLHLSLKGLLALADGFKFVGGDLLFLGEAVGLDAGGKGIDLVGGNAEFQPGGQTLFENLGKATEFVLDGGGFADKGLEDAVLGALLVEEVVAVNLGGRLKFTVNAPIPLFQAAGVPRDIVVEKVVAVGLEVEAFPGGVGGEENADRIGGRVGVEGRFDGFPLIGTGGTAVNFDAGVGLIGAGKGVGEQIPQIGEARFPFGEDDDAAIRPFCALFGGVAIIGDARALVRGNPLEEF